MDPPKGMAEARQRKGLTQREAAKALGVAQNTIHRWESGLSFPRQNNLHNMAKLYGCEVEDLAN